MILKVPLYIEIDGRFSPGEAQEFQMLLRSEIYGALDDTVRRYHTSMRFKGTKYKMKFLTESAVKKALISPKEPEEPWSL